MTILKKLKFGLVLVFGVFLSEHPSRAMADEPPTFDGPLKVVPIQQKPITEGYRLHMVGAYGVTVASIWAGPVPFLFTASFAAPLVHISHQNQKATAASIGVRAILLASGWYWGANCFSISFSLDGSDTDEEPQSVTCDLTETTFALSLIATPVIDFAMAYETLPPVKLGVLIRPPVRENPAFFGVGGVF